MNDVKWQDYLTAAWGWEPMLWAVVICAIGYLWLRFSVKASYRQIKSDLRNGAILNGLQYSPAESEKILEDSNDTWKVTYCYRTPKGSFFLYRANFGPMGWKGSRFQPITKEEAMDMLASKSVEQYTKVFGKPKKT